MPTKRGRKSSAALAVVPISIEGYRPQPPAELRPAEVKVWKAIVASVPGGWFTRANEPLLCAYCRHVVAGDKVSKMVEAEQARDEIDIAKLSRLLNMRLRESNAAMSLARTMRLTQQAQMHPRTAGRAMTGAHGGPKLWDRKPWEI